MPQDRVMACSRVDLPVPFSPDEDRHRLFKFNCPGVGKQRQVEGIIRLVGVRVGMQADASKMQNLSFLVFETALPGIDHSRTDFIAGFDTLEIVHRPTGLDDGPNAFLQSDIDAVPEGEESVTDHGGTD